MYVQCIAEMFDMSALEQCLFSQQCLYYPKDKPSTFMSWNEHTTKIFDLASRCSSKESELDNPDICVSQKSLPEPNRSNCESEFSLSWLLQIKTFLIWCQFKRANKKGRGIILSTLVQFAAKWRLFLLPCHYIDIRKCSRKETVVKFLSCGRPCKKHAYSAQTDHHADV